MEMAVAILEFFWWCGLLLGAVLVGLFLFVFALVIPIFVFCLIFSAVIVIWDTCADFFTNTYLKFIMWKTNKEREKEIKKIKEGKNER